MITRVLSQVGAVLGRAAFALVAAVLAVFAHVTGVVAAPATGTMTQVSSLTEAMKVIFSDPVVNNMVVESELLGRFRAESNIRTDDTTGGRYIEMAHYFQLPAGVGARQEDDYLPVADRPRFVNSRVWLSKVQGTIEMTGDVMRRVTSSEGAFLDYAQQALPDFTQRLVHEVDRMVLGIGSGVKSRIANVTASVGGIAFTGGISAFNTPAAGQFAILIDRTMGITGLTQAFLHYLEGERLVFTATLSNTNVTLKNPGTGQSARVISIDEDNGILVLEGLDALRTALAANDYVGAGDGAGHSLPGAAPTGGTIGYKEMAGLFAGADDGNIFAVYNHIDRSVAANRLWRSIVVDAASASLPFNGVLNEELFAYADDQVSVRGGGRPDLIVTSRSGSRSYWKSLKSDRFFMDPRGNYASGKAGLQIILGDRSLPLVVARKLPPESTFMLQTDTWRRLTLGTWEWDDTTGSIWNRVTDTTGRRDAYFAVGNGYEQLFCIAPRKNVRIDGLTSVT